MKITHDSDSNPSNQYKFTWEQSITTKNHDSLREIIHARTR